MSGHSTGTLNHLSGPGPLKEWVDVVVEEERLVERLRRLTAERASHEVVLLMAGVSRDAMNAALDDARSVKSA